ncbi:MAG TPA: YceI family protein [Rhizomicrobium sp.]|nr:YceI family protein [Rhizomicrobium sp.]
MQKRHYLTIGATIALLSLAPTMGASADPDPKSIPMGQHDYKLSPAGKYHLDPNHVGVIARVSHMGFSISIFRFGKVAATLDWNPGDITKSKLSATVVTNSIETNVPGFAEQLQGDQYLKSAMFPEATFVSTAFRQTDPQHGKVDGKFTLMGKTVPVTFDTTLIGAGPGFAGSPVMGHVIGIHAETAINPQDFGMSPFFTMPIQLVIDTEFDKPGK